MAKIMDYTEVAREIARQLALNNYDIVDYLGYDLTLLAVLNIYETNDVCKGFGQDFHNGWSVIAYESLTDDIHEILMVIQAVIDRMDF